MAAYRHPLRIAGAVTALGVVAACARRDVALAGDYRLDTTALRDLVAGSLAEFGAMPLGEVVAGAASGELHLGPSGAADLRLSVPLLCQVELRGAWSSESDKVALRSADGRQRFALRRAADCLTLEWPFGDGSVELRLGRAAR